MTAQSPGGTPAADLACVRFIFTYCIQIWAQSGRLCAHNPPGASCFTEVRKKKMGKDFSFSMTGDSSTWLCLCSLPPPPMVGSLYCVHLERSAEIPQRRVLFSLSSHLYSATTYLLQAPSPHHRFSNTVFQGTTVLALIASFWELTAVLHLPYSACFSH